MSYILESLKYACENVKIHILNFKRYKKMFIKIYCVLYNTLSLAHGCHI